METAGNSLSFAPELNKNSSNNQKTIKVMKTKNSLSSKSKAIIACLFAAVMSLSFSACSEYDNPVEPASQALTNQIQGQWIAINDFQGEDVKAYFDEEDFDDVEGIDPSIFDAHREVVYV